MIAVTERASQLAKLADIAFNVLTLDDTFATGAWPDAAWTCGYPFVRFQSQLQLVDLLSQEVILLLVQTT